MLAMIVLGFFGGLLAGNLLGTWATINRLKRDGRLDR